MPTRVDARETSVPESSIERHGTMRGYGDVPAGTGIAYAAFSAFDKHKSPGKATVGEFALPAIGVVDGVTAAVGGVAGLNVILTSTAVGPVSATRGFPFGGGAAVAIGVAAVLGAAALAYQAATNH